MVHTNSMNEAAGLKYAEEVGIPDKCLKCPVLRELGSDYAKYSEMADQTIGVLMDGKTEEFAKEQLLAMGMPPEEVDAFVAENSEALVQTGKGAVEFADIHRDVRVRTGRTAVAGCSGALTMRARRGEQEVRVTVCMSDEIDDINAQTRYEATTIVRSIVPDAT